ncbi:b(0,+)-type amino acid transporter 1-like [Daphnia pulex]|uniref:b(0,+)-type amino acid transporter 1-like n=1 Tax=Daphnia pulex TaxID=6669 RepID=UPI001EDE3F6B|nr:b(0,+)-type amino acid transporter 1-like [Daphnia pulex]
MENAAFDSCASEVNNKGELSVEGKPNPEAQEGLELKRKVGLFSGVALIVGNMIGSGIFISPGGVLERSGSVGLSLVMWAACGLLAILGSLSYAELGTLIPKSGGEYSYLLDGLTPLHPFWGPLPAFLYSWISVLLLRPTTFAVGCLSCASYTVYPILASMGLCLETETEELLIKLTAVLYIGLISALNVYSVDWTIRVQNFFTVAKLAAIAVLVGCGIYQLSTGETQYLAQGFKGSTTEFGTIATAFYGGLWSYDGWNNLNFITEEIKNPYVNLPRAIMIGIPLVTVCYLAVNVAYLTVLSPQALINSDAVAVDIGNYLLGPLAFTIPLAVAMSTFGGVLSSAFATGRLCFATAREGHMVDVLSYIHVDSRIPSPALMFTAIIALVLVISKNVSSLIDFFTFAVWIFYVLTMIVLLILRKTRPDARRPYKVPLFVPILTIIIGSYLVVAPIVTDPAIEYLYVLGALIIGVLFYIPFVFYKCSLGFMGPITRSIQIALNVGPTLKPMAD